MRLPNGLTLPDQVGAFFRREETAPRIEPRFRPWALRQYVRIFSYAPPPIFAPNPQTRFTRPTAPLTLAPQVSDRGGV